MRAGRLIGATFLLAVLATQAAASNALSDRCGWEDNDSFGNCAIEYAGAPSARSYAAQGAELIRVVVTKPGLYRGALIIVEVVLPKSGDAQIIVRDPYGGLRPRIYAIGRDRFAALRATLLDTDHLAKAFEIGARERAARAASHGCELETICLHPAVGFVDTVLDGVVAEVTIDACGDVFKIVEDILAVAVKADPACADNLDDWAPMTLRACLRLGGDRAVSAKVLAAATRLGDAFSESGSRRADATIQDSISGEARLEIFGGPFARGPDRIQKAMLGILRGGHIAVESASADSDGVVVRGVIQRSAGEGEQTVLYEARCVQIWRLDGGEAHLIVWHVDRFVLSPTPY